MINQKAFNAILNCLVVGVGKVVSHHWKQTSTPPPTICLGTCAHITRFSLWRRLASLRYCRYRERHINYYEVVGAYETI